MRLSYMSIRLTCCCCPPDHACRPIKVTSGWTYCPEEARKHREDLSRFLEHLFPDEKESFPLNLSRQAISEDMLNVLEEQGVAPLQLAKLRTLSGARRGDMGAGAGTLTKQPAVSMQRGISALRDWSCLAHMGPLAHACDPRACRTSRCSTTLRPFNGGVCVRGIRQLGYLRRMHMPSCHQYVPHACKGPVWCLHGAVHAGEDGPPQGVRGRAAGSGAGVDCCWRGRQWPADHGELP